MAKDILFPFDSIRPVQEELIKDTKKAIESGNHLVAHAPTGLGKTAASFSAALAYALKNDLTVFFLTPKHSQHQIAVETLKEIKKKFNIAFTAIDLIGKKWMCSVPGIEDLTTFEFREHCRIQRKNNECKFYKRTFKNNKLQPEIKDLLDELKNKSPEHVEDFVSKCQDMEICAYELASVLCESATVIIADYYHIFHPKIKEHFLKKIGKDLEKSIIIVDEAHNLPNRIMDTMSAILTTSVLTRAAKEARKFLYADLAISIHYIKDALENLALKLEPAASNSNSEMYVKKEDFFQAVENATGEDYALLLEDLEDAAEQIREEQKKSYVGSVAGFLQYWLGSDDDGFCRILKREVSKQGNEFISLNYNCLSASIVAGPIIDESWSTILMSGTLTPGTMYRDILGIASNRVLLREYQNPFPSRNRLVLIDPEVTTKFTERSEYQWKLIGQRAKNTIENVPGNSAIFFPSYSIMQSVLPFLEDSNKKLLLEEQDMNKNEKRDFIDVFKSYHNNGGAALLGVQGGSLSEGIDLPGDFLKAVVVVGVPLARPDLLTKALIEFYDREYKMGWEYGYLFPAINRTLQAAGRCIRSHTDRGVIVFMDRRFAWDQYKKYIPKDWNARKTNLVAINVKRFFENNKT